MASVASRAQPTPQGLGSQKLLPMLDHGGAGLGCSTKNIHTHPTVIHSKNPDLLSTVLQLLTVEGAVKGSVLYIVYSPPSILRRYRRWFR